MLTGENFIFDLKTTQNYSARHNQPIPNPLTQNYKNINKTKKQPPQNTQGNIRPPKTKMGGLKSPKNVKQLPPPQVRPPRVRAGAGPHRPINSPKYWGSKPVIVSPFRLVILSWFEPRHTLLLHPSEIYHSLLKAKNWQSVFRTTHPSSDLYDEGISATRTPPLI